MAQLITGYFVGIMSSFDIGLSNAWGSEASKLTQF